MSETLPPAVLDRHVRLSCPNCDREMQFDALEVVTRLYVYACDCGNERKLTRSEIEALVFDRIRSGLGFGRKI
jgi:hypothetical protein